MTSAYDEDYLVMRKSGEQMNEFLWVEKYRPNTIEECVLPDRLKNTFTEIVQQGEIPNMLLCGTAGTGKTTVVKAFVMN